MPNLTTDRAVKKAYFSNLEGGRIVEFQFSPASLGFEESSKYATRVKTGSYFTDLVWISGNPNAFNIRMFIDRTQESYTSENYNQDPFSSFRRFPNQSPRFTSLDSVNLVRGIASSNSSSGFASSFKKNTKEGGKEIQPSNYSASPHFKQSQFNESVGVTPDLEALMYYVRPKGFQLDEITTSNNQVVSVSDFDNGRFTPPPMVRFYYGNMWREGYIIRVKYNLSVMNKLLVPRRLDADITMACTKWGYLNELDNALLNEAIDTGGNSDNLNTFA